MKKENIHFSNLNGHTPAAAAATHLFRGVRPDMTLPLWQEGVGGCVMALYYCIIVRSLLVTNSHYRNDGKL